VIVDYHMHLRDPAGGIDHTHAAVERYVDVAVARGVDEIGFTEHVYYFAQTRELWTLPYQLDRCHFDLDGYCEAVLAAKKQGLPVKLGLEVDYVGELQPRLAELLAPYPWDYLLGSVHWLEGQAIDQEPGLWARSSTEDVWEQYFVALRELTLSGAVDVLAHPDLPKIFGRSPSIASLARLHGEAADVIAERGVCIEISTAGLRKPVGEMYPHPSFLKACVGRGVGVTLASDAHEPKLVGEDFDLALALAASVGCGTVAVFDGRNARTEPLG